jgi:hypothetical protein
MCRKPYKMSETSIAFLAVVEIKFTSLANVARLRHIQNLCGFSTPTAMGQSFIMTLYIFFSSLSLLVILFSLKSRF